MSEVTVKKMGRKAVKAVNSIVDFMALVAIFLLVTIAVYAIWDSEKVYQAAYSAQYAVYRPSEKEDNISFQELQRINPEVFSWLTVYGTKIDYPVAQGSSNMKYVNNNIFGEYSLSGSIFLDSDNDKGFQDFNSILYGHHMEKQAMFGELASFSDKDFFNRHAYGNLYYNGKDHGLEFFAFIKTDAYDGVVFTPCIQGEKAQQEYLQRLLDQALYTRDIGVTAENRILLLTTCSSDATNGRDILAARITDEHYNDTFNTEEISNANGQASVDRQTGLWGKIPGWLKIMLPIILLILLAIAVYHKFRRKRTKE